MGMKHNKCLPQQTEYGKPNFLSTHPKEIATGRVSAHATQQKNLLIPKLLPWKSVIPVWTTSVRR